MNLRAIYPGKSLTKLGNGKYIHPYLLRHLDITHSNHVWSIDITYIPMKKGFLYLTAIIDVYSRYIVGWGISNTLDGENSLNVLKEYIYLNPVNDGVELYNGVKTYMDYYNRKRQHSGITGYKPIDWYENAA